jgi:hypothetical protein
MPVLGVQASAADVASVVLDGTSCAASDPSQRCSGLSLLPQSAGDMGRFSLTDVHVRCEDARASGVLLTAPVGQTIPLQNMSVFDCRGGIEVLGVVARALSVVEITDLRVERCSRPTANACASGGKGGALLITGLAVSVTVDRGVLVDNSAQEGGAVHAERLNVVNLGNGSPTVSLRNVLMRNNSAACAFCSGGAVSFTDSSFELVNCTLERNTAGSTAGAIYAVVSALQSVARPLDELSRRAARRAMPTCLC